MSANDWLAQDLADMLDVPVERPAFVETTALGAAMLAGIGCGLYGSLQDAAAMRGEVAAFTPAIERGVRDRRLGTWRTALDAVLRD
jgi:glycerol kinase